MTDVREKGAPRDGQPQILDRRLFFQFQAFTGCGDGRRLVDAACGAGIDCVVYEDATDPRGVGLLFMSESEDFFVTDLRRLFDRDPFAGLTPRPELTMFGRTYASGFEPDLEEWLLKRPRRVVSNREWPWAIWYPLRRKGEFATLSPEKQTAILREHGGIGRAFGEADLAHDVRLVCHGMDRDDNDFVIGLIGKHLQPLSAVVQAMRKTVQTSSYLDRLGPFFVGKAVR